jgi:ribonuclease P protein component
LKQFGLSSKERIKNKKDFDLVYTSGEVIIAPTQKIKAIFFIEKVSPEPGVKTAYAVSHKAGNAVWRNRFKRLLRESYRLNKEILKPDCETKNLKLLLVFSPNMLNQRKNKKINLMDVMPDVIALMNRIKAKL